MNELKQYYEKVPKEIRLQTQALSTNESWGLLIFIYENDGITLSELKNKFGEDITEVIKKLLMGGLIRQYVHNSQYIGIDSETKYSVTVIGKSIVERIYNEYL